MNNSNTKLAGLILSGLSLALLAGCNEEAQADSASAGSATAKVGREVCTEKTVTTEKEAKDKHRVLGTVAGAVVGGVVGNEVGGKGTSQDVATVAGAAAGGYAGNRVQKSMQDGNTEETTKVECRTVYD